MYHEDYRRVSFEGTTLFKDEWKPELGESFQTMVEEANEYDRYAVAVHV